MNILVTGGAGYIGSHTLVELINAGHSVVAVDNLSNSSREALRRVEQITGASIPFYRADIRDRDALSSVLSGHACDCCIHFAGLKAVGESTKEPLLYYENNVGGTLALLDVLKKHDCKNFIFSSSATVYGKPAIVPITEDCPRGVCANPYGRTKAMLEDILIDCHEAYGFNVVILRYFNPIGAHPSGLIGEAPQNIPNNLMPYITQVAVGKLAKLRVYGTDYDTPDGTGIRDYVHVSDLARGHVAALKALNRGLAVYNLGTGRGYSVFEVIRAFEEASGLKIPYETEGRRPGDIAMCYSDPSKAERELGWRAESGLFEMCRDSWNWQRRNPDGFEPAHEHTGQDTN